MTRRRRRPKQPQATGASVAAATPRVSRSADCIALLAVLFVSFAALQGVLRNGFLNWDDEAALVRNAALDAGRVVAWAFTTGHMGHYQPLSWLTWAAVRRLLGVGPAAHHLASLLLHLLNTALVFVLAWRMASISRLSTAAGRAAATSAALFFGIHPLRVEPVAWASAFPYPLALAPLLLSVLAYLGLMATAGGSLPLLLISLLLYALSLLCRAAAPAFPALLLLLDWLLGRLERVGWKRAVVEKLPYAALAVLASIAEAGTRRFAPLERVGLGARLSDAAIAPFVYLFRSVWPVGLSPLDPQPLEARTSALALLLGFVLIAGLTALTYRLRAGWPVFWAAWLAYLLLLGPALGVTPSGLQATADRYAYFPSVALALLVGAGAARLWADAGRRGRWLVLAVTLVMALAVASWRQVGFWRDSATLWTRALELNPSNDIALYNLALALAEAGDEVGAATRYEELLMLVPDHAPARHNLDLIEAHRFEAEAGRLAASGRLDEAVALYGRALERDPARLHSRRSRGMALAQLGRLQEAIPDLRAAVAPGPAEPAVAAALAFALTQDGERDEAIRVLRDAVARHPGDTGLAADLARLERRDGQGRQDTIRSK